MPDLVLSAGGDHVLREPPRSFLPLDSRTDIATLRNKIAIRQGHRDCIVSVPSGWQLEALTKERLPRTVASSAGAVLVLLARPERSLLLPVRIDVLACRATRGKQMRRPEFDLQLQGYANGWWLSSTSENALLHSTDGLSWREMDLPEDSHALLGAHVDRHGMVWVAVSQANLDFRLQTYVWHREANKWFIEQPDRAPESWLDLARLLAEERPAARSEANP